LWVRETLCDFCVDPVIFIMDIFVSPDKGGIEHANPGGIYSLVAGGHTKEG
jgi:hypothetical protein